jgi:hypothetical protein
VNARTAALPIAWALIAAGALPAIAQERASPSSGHVELEVKGCPAVPTAAVRRVLGIEIGDLLLEASAGDVQDVDRLIIRCAGNFAAVEATGISGGAPTERILRLDDFPGDAAPRALALLGVELLAARSAAVRERILRRRTGAAAPAVETVAASPPSAALPTLGGREVRIGVAAVARTFLAQAHPVAFGGQLQASATAMRFGLVSGDVEFVAARKDVDNVGETTALLVSGAATFGPFIGGRRWRAAAGLGARGGLVRESGSSADPARISSSAFVRPWGGPVLSATLSGTLGRRVALAINGEAGWSLSSIDEMAAGVTAISVRGLWVALSIGADLRR